MFNASNPYRLEFPQLPDLDVMVLNFRREQSLDNDLSWQVLVKLREPASALLQQPVTLTCEEPPSDIAYAALQPPLVWHAYVTSLKRFGDGSDKYGYRYELTLNSALWPLKLSGKNRVFIGQTVPEIVKQVCAPFAEPGLNIEWHLIKAYAPLDMVAQLNESNFDFLRRLLSQAGIGFSFFPNPNDLPWVLFDDSRTLPVASLATLAFVPAGNIASGDYHVSSLRQGGKLIGKNIVIRYYAVSNCPWLIPGLAFNVIDHPIAERNGRYRILSIEETASAVQQQSKEIETNNGYRNNLVLLKEGADSLAYQPELLRTPLYHGTLSAIIESSGGPYAELDEQGRYHVRLPFDTSDNTNTQASPPLPLLQPYGGKREQLTAGYHFPLQPGTEVAMGFVDSDINKPFILGVFNNETAPSPVTNENKTQHVISSWGGSHLVLDDNAQNPEIVLATRNDQNQLRLNAHPETPYVQLESKQGQVAINAKQNIQHTAGGNTSLNAGNNLTHQVSGNYQATIQGDINYQAAQDLTLQSNQTLNQASQQHNFTQQAGNKLKVNAKDIGVQSQQGNINLVAPQGDMRLQSGNDINLTAQNQASFLIQQNEAMFGVSPAGALFIKAKNIRIQSSQINVKGDLHINETAPGSAWQPAAPSSEN